MRKAGAIAFVLAASLCCTLSHSVLAQDPIHKARRGLINIATGWIEIPRQIHEGRNDGNPLRGFGMGIVRGFLLAALRSGVGIYETLTFAWEHPKNFASPYEEMDLKDYAWQ